MDNPFAIISDLRIFSHCVSDNFIGDNYSEDNDVYKFEFPDNLIDLIRVKNGFPYLF